MKQGALHLLDMLDNTGALVQGDTYLTADVRNEMAVCYCGRGGQRLGQCHWQLGWRGNPTKATTLDGQTKP